MRLRKTPVCVLLIGVCLICVARTSPLQVKDHETTRTFRSSSSTFGVKTSSQPTSSGQRGHFSEVISTNAHVQSGNEKPLFQSSQSANSEDQLSQKSQDVPSQHVSGQDSHQHFSGDSVPESSARQNDDSVFGLLPAVPNPQRPGNFGTRIQGRNTQVSCTVKGGCDTSVSTFTGDVGSQFHDAGFGNQQSHQGQSVEFPVQQSHQGQSVEFPVQQSHQGQSVEFPVQQSHQGQSVEFPVQQTEEKGIQSGGVSPKRLATEQQDEIDQVVEELDQEIREAFGDDFVGNDQYENTFQNTDQRSFVDEPNVPILDSEFPEYNGPVSFQAEKNVADPYQEQDEGSQTSDDFQDSQNPEFFGYIEPQTRSDVAPFDQTPEDFYQEPEEQQSFGGNGGFSEDQYRGSAGDQGNFQQRFVPQRQVPNENRDFYEDGGENLFLPERDPIESLRYNVPGSPGDDYPIFYKVPDTPFQCNQQQFAAGIYGDTDAQCQVFHFCKETGGHDSFLCPNGTVFNQQYFVCDWWYNYNCSDTPSFYNLNAQLYWDFDSLAPSQILSGTGVGSQEEFHDQADAQVGFVGNRPIQTFGGVGNQESVSSVRFPQGGVNQQHSTATRQQVFDSKVVAGQQTSSFAEKRVDASVGRGRNTATSATQSQSNSFDFRSTSTAFEGNSAGRVPDTHQQEQHVSYADDFTQTPIEPVDFQQRNVPEQTGFVQSQTSSSDESAHSDEFFRNDLNQNPIESFGEVTSNKATSDEFQNDNLNQGFQSSFLDVNTHSQSNVHDDVQQNAFAQQHIEDEHSVVQDKDVQHQEEHGTADFNTNFESSRDLSTSFESSHFSQDTQTDFSSGSDNAQDVQKQDTDFALDGRNDAGFNVVENSGATSSAGFDSQNFEDQQQVNVDPSFEDAFFRTREVPSLPFPDSAAAVSGVQTGFESTNVQQGVTNKQANAEEFSQENLDVHDLNTDLPLVRTGGTDSGSQAIQRGSSVFSRNELSNQEVVDVPKTNQDKVDFDEILDGFRTRNIAFMDTNAGSQLTGTGDGINGNSQVAPFSDNIQSTKQDDNDFVQKSFEEISFPQEEAKNSNVDSPRQDTSPVFQQQNFQVQDIFNMMRGLPSASALQKFQNGQTTDQQRLSFRPYGQNATPNLNSNEQGKNDKVFEGQNTQEKVQNNGFIQTQSTLDENNQNQQRLSFRPYGQNVSPRLNSNNEARGQNGNVLANQNVQDNGSKNTHQDVSQRNVEKVIFPDAQQNGERRNSWRPTQQRGNTNFQDFSDQPVQTFIEQSDRRVNKNELSRGSINNQGPSNVNRNVQTNTQQVSTQGFQEDRQIGAAPNVNVIHGNQNRLNVKENVQPQFQNSVQFNSGRTNLQVINKNSGVKGLNIQNQHQDQPGVRNSINENHQQNDRNGGLQFPNQPQDHPARRHPIDENFQRNSVSGEVFDQGQRQDQFNSRPDFQVHNDFNTRHTSQEQNADQFNSRPVPQIQNVQFDGRHVSQEQNRDQFNSLPVPQNQDAQFDGRHISQNQNVDQFNSRPIPQNQNAQFDGRHVSQEQNRDQFNSRPVSQIQNDQFDGRHISQEQNADQFNSRPVPQNQDAQFDGRHISQNQNVDQFNSRPIPQNQNAQFDGRHVSQEQNRDQFNSRPVSQIQNDQFDGRHLSQEQNADQFNSRPVSQIHNVQFDGRQIIQEQNVAQFNSRSASQGENNVHFNSGHTQPVQHDVQFNSRPIPQDQNVAQFNLSPHDQQARHPSNVNPLLNSNVKGFQVQESGREGRSNANFGQPNVQIHAQKIEASDVRVYSQNDPSSAASSVSYNGWKPIVRQ